MARPEAELRRLATVAIDRPENVYHIRSYDERTRTQGHLQTLYERESRRRTSGARPSAVGPVPEPDSVEPMGVNA